MVYDLRKRQAMWEGEVEFCLRGSKSMMNSDGLWGGNGVVGWEFSKRNG